MQQRKNKMYLSHTPKSPFASCLRATFQDIVLCGVIFETRMCSCPPALGTSGPRHLPPLHLKPIEILSESFELPRGSRNPFCRLLYTTYASLWTIADCKAVPSSIALQQHPIPNHPPYFLLPQHTAVRTQSCTLDTRRCPDKA